MNPSVPWWREMSRYQWLVLVVAWLGWVFDIMDTALFNLAKVKMLTDLLGGEAAYKSQGPQIEGEIQTLFIVGWAIGGLLFGILADRWGRTRVLVATILLYCLFTGLTGFCQTWQQVAAIRFLTAIGIGGEWAAGAALIAEVVPNRARAGAAAILQTAAAFGPILAATANLALANESWRWLFAVGILPAALTVVIRFGVKEPETWKSAVANDKGTFWTPVKELFGSKTMSRNVLIAMIIGLVGIAGAGNIAFWMPNLVKQALDGVDPAIVAQRTSYVTYCQHVGTLLGVLVFPMICERFGRRLAIGGFFGLSMGALLLSLYGGAPTYESLLWKAPLMNFFMIGLTAGFGLYFPELFPTRLRATGVSFAYNVARIGQAPIPWITGLIIALPGSNPAFGVLVAGAIYVLGIMVLPFAPETKGKPLPEG